jgi:hypothetical protein
MRSLKMISDLNGLNRQFHGHQLKQKTNQNKRILFHWIETNKIEQLVFTHTYATSMKLFFNKSLDNLML